MKVANFLKCILSIIVFVSFISGRCFGQVSFYAEVDNKVVGKTEYIQVSFTVKNARQVEQIVPPSFNNFTVVNGPSQQSGITNINGSVTQTQSIVYVLQPKHTGNFMIGAASATADGKTYKSIPISIQVTNRASNNNMPVAPNPFAMEDIVPQSPHEYDDYILKKGENVADKIRKNVFVKVDVSKQSCYVGEPIVATYKLYSRLKSESNLTKTPSFNGFSVNELGKPDGYNVSTETLNGREYNVYILRKVELYPLQAGKLELESVEVENNITFIEDYKNKSLDNLQRLLQSLSNGSNSSDGLVQQKVTLKNKPVTINVLPLPATILKDFKGAVGNFSITSVLENATVYQEDGGNLVVTVSGAGNIQMVNAPKINWPAGIDGFEPVNTENIDKHAVPISGDRTFKYSFSTSKIGTYTISPISFTYFDLGSKSYKTISSDSLVLHVKPGVGARPVAKPVSDNGGFVIDTKWVLGVGFMVIGCVVFLLLLFNKKKEPEIKEVAKPNEKTMAVKHVVDEPLAKVEALIDGSDSKQFYVTFKDKLLSYLAKKLNVSKEELNRKKISDGLDKKRVDTLTIFMLTGLLDEIDLHLYSASSPTSEMNMAYAKGLEVIALIEKQII